VIGVGNNEPKNSTIGYQVELQTQVTRTRDGIAIAEGIHTIWVPDYLRM
jgi:hypothetical protein